jgi:hypothetical protein
VRNFLSHEEALKIDIQMDKLRKRSFFCNTYTIIKNAMNNHWKENSGRNTIFQGKKLPVTERNFLSQENLSVTWRNLLSREDTSCDRNKHSKQMDEHNAEKENENCWKCPFFKMLTQSLSMLWTIIGKKTVKMEIGTL